MTQRVERSEAELREIAARHGQEHVFKFWSELDREQRARLHFQINGIDFDLLSRLCEELVTGEDTESEDEAPAGDLEPADVLPLDGDEAGAGRAREARERGEALLSEGRVSAFVVAGGQGTRLGFDAPKGTFPIGPVSERTLFQIQAERLRALSKRHGSPIPWYILVSEDNDSATRDHFAEHDHYGLDPEDVRFLRQDTIPSVDRKGKILLSDADRVATNPNGHGGSLKALHDSGALAEMRERGIESIFYFHVDNPLVRICDPVFVGLHELERTDITTKVVPKTGPEEKVGVLCKREGRTVVVEYINLPEELAEQRDPSGDLRFWGGSIGIHVLSREFVESLNEGGFRLPYHAARKAIPYLETSGSMARERVRPKYPNGIKFETFVFDAFEYSEKTVAIATERAAEFSPVKNSKGVDSVDSCRRDMTRLYLGWLEARGARIARSENGEFEGHVEISPLTATSAEELEGVVDESTVVEDGFRI